jgi:hypothetical protein
VANGAFTHLRFLTLCNCSGGNTSGETSNRLLALKQGEWPASAGWCLGRAGVYMKLKVMFVGTFNIRPEGKTKTPAS